MDFYNTKLNNKIHALHVDDFDVYKWGDINQLKNIFRHLFLNKDEIFFSFRREESLTDRKELQELRSRISEIFNENGEYVILRQIDQVRFDSVARLDLNDHSINFIFDFWKYFYSCSFFVPVDRFTFSDFISFYKSVKFEDKWNEKLLSNLFTNFTCIKDLGGTNLIITYRNGYHLLDLNDIDTPDIDQIFR